MPNNPPVERGGHDGTPGPGPVPEAPEWFPALVAAREVAPGAAPEVVALQLARQGLLLAGRSALPLLREVAAGLETVTALLRSAQVGRFPA